ncbi:sorting nexin-3 isoform X2 [Erinaceus europaeus]|uniref:Sorting nexin-3 isoform X2 n=1 Tax=Erinaceus europaeus TaxID=9365 RepID=A0ABM3XCV1_ERIEU|nr:sorting nexin-3 isoform X2 [Erinaceus europaeus]
MAETVADTRRLITKPQNLNDAYGPPSNFLEIDVSNPQTVGVGRGRFTTYEIRVKTNLPIFKLKESTVRRRYSDFEWLRSELERESKRQPEIEKERGNGRGGGGGRGDRHTHTPGSLEKLPPCRSWSPRSLGRLFCVSFPLEETMEYLTTVLLKKESKDWSSL